MYYQEFMMMSLNDVIMSSSCCRSIWYEYFNLPCDCSHAGTPRAGVCVWSGERCPGAGHLVENGVPHLQYHWHQQDPCL